LRGRSSKATPAEPPSEETAVDRKEGE